MFPSSSQLLEYEADHSRWTRFAATPVVPTGRSTYPRENTIIYCYRQHIGMRVISRPVTAAAPCWPADWPKSVAVTLHTATAIAWDQRGPVRRTRGVVRACRCRHRYCADDAGTTGNTAVAGRLRRVPHYTDSRSTDGAVTRRVHCTASRRSLRHHVPVVNVILLSSVDDSAVTSEMPISIYLQSCDVFRRSYLWVNVVLITSKSRSVLSLTSQAVQLRMHSLKREPEIEQTS